MSSELAEVTGLDQQVGDIHRSVCEDVYIVKHKGSISWNIPDFLDLMKFQYEEDSVFKSSELVLKFDDNASYKFVIHLMVNSRSDDNISIILENVSGQSLKIRFVMNIIDNTGNETKKLAGVRTFPANESKFGFLNFLSKKELKENQNQLLPDNTLRIRCNLFIYVSQISVITHEDIPASDIEGPNLMQDVAKLWNNPEFTDFQLKCSGQVSILVTLIKTKLHCRNLELFLLDSFEHFVKQLM